MADATIPSYAGDDLVRHLEVAHCAVIGCGPRGVLPEAGEHVPHHPAHYAAELHEADHAMRYTDGTSPFGHVHAAARATGDAA